MPKPDRELTQGPFIDGLQPFTIGKTPFATRLNTEFVTVGPRQWEREGALASDLYTQYLQPITERYRRDDITFIQAFNGFANFKIGLMDSYTRGKYRQKNKLSGGYQQTNRRESSHSLSRFVRSDQVLATLIIDLSERFASDTANKASEADVMRVAQTTTVLEAAIQQYPEAAEVLHTFGFLIERLESWKEIYAWMEGLRKSPAIRRVLQEVPQEQLLQSVESMRNQLMHMRERNVPLGIFDSPLFLDSHNAFRTYDRSFNIPNMDEESIAQTNMPFEKNFAHIALGRKPLPTAQLQPSITQQTLGRGQLHEIAFPAHNIAIFRLENDGTFYTHFQGRMPLRQAFASQEAVEEGLLFEVFLLMRLYDLTGRPAIIANMPSIGDFEASTVRQTTGVRGVVQRLMRHSIAVGDFSYNFDYIRQLVTPRLIQQSRITSKDVRTDEIEIKETPEEPIVGESTITYANRSVPVSATLRKLPKGYHASDTAKNMARDFFGIHDLPKGWTLVSSHMGIRRVRINTQTGEILVRKFEFKGADDDVILRLQEMVATIQKGEDPHRRQAGR